MPFVSLSAKRNRGWPWPEDSWGLDPIYGPDGWCRSCGTPNRTQIGSLVLQRRGMKTEVPAWSPNWRFDAYCFSPGIANELAARFALEFRPIRWRSPQSHEAMQLVLPEPQISFFDQAQLTSRLEKQHGKAGAACDTCGIWRWFPLGFEPVPPMYTEALPPVRHEVRLLNDPIAVSREWFGDGCRSLREVLFAAEIAEIVVTASPRDFEIVEPTWA